MQVKAATEEIYVTYLFTSQAAESRLTQKCRHSLVLICGDRDRSCGDGVGMGTVFMGTGGDGVQFLSPCRPLIQMSLVGL